MTRGQVVIYGGIGIVSMLVWTPIVLVWTLLTKQGPRMSLRLLIAENQDASLREAQDQRAGIKAQYYSRFGETFD